MTSTIIYSKICSTCNDEKPFTEFTKNKARKDGFHNQCKSCRKLDGKNYYEENKEFKLIYGKQWRDKNKSRMAEWNRLYVEENRGKVNAKNARRYAAKIRATPLWSETKDIEKLYEQCQLISSKTGIEHHVDHIVPLNSEIVSGLHCLANLRILPARENREKSNLYWPDMPQ